MNEGMRAEDLQKKKLMISKNRKENSFQTLVKDRNLLKKQVIKLKNLKLKIKKRPNNWLMSSKRKFKPIKSN